jgi:hypothetical protein
VPIGLSDKASNWRVLRSDRRSKAIHDVSINWVEEVQCLMRWVTAS